MYVVGILYKYRLILVVSTWTKFKFLQSLKIQKLTNVIPFTWKLIELCVSYKQHLTKEALYHSLIEELGQKKCVVPVTQPTLFYPDAKLFSDFSTKNLEYKNNVLVRNESSTKWIGYEYIAHVVLLGFYRVSQLSNMAASSTSACL